MATSDLHAQMRTAAFERWTPPRIDAERTTASISDSVQVRVGSHAGKGALIGAAVGAGVGVILGLVVGSGAGCSDCGEQPSELAYAAGGGLIGAGAGGLIGLLFGLSSPRYEWRPSTGEVTQ
jgi:hypothetical protein